MPVGVQLVCRHMPCPEQHASAVGALVQPVWRPCGLWLQCPEQSHISVTLSCGGMQPFT